LVFARASLILANRFKPLKWALCFQSTSELIFTVAYDEGLAERLREQFQHRTDVEIKKMFGGLCFMVSNHMCCGIVGDTLMGRVAPDLYENYLSMDHVSEMDFTGKAMKGMIYVSPAGFESDSDLTFWVNTCIKFVESLPPKKPRKKKT